MTYPQAKSDNGMNIVKGTVAPHSIIEPVRNTIRNVSIATEQCKCHCLISILPNVLFIIIVGHPCYSSFNS